MSQNRTSSYAAHYSNCSLPCRTLLTSSLHLSWCSGCLASRYSVQERATGRVHSMHASQLQCLTISSCVIPLEHESIHFVSDLKIIHSHSSIILTALQHNSQTHKLLFTYPSCQQHIQEVQMLSSSFGFFDQLLHVNFLVCIL